MIHEVKGDILGVVLSIGDVEGVQLLPATGVLADHDVLGPHQAAPLAPFDLELQLKVLMTINTLEYKASYPGFLLALAFGQVFVCLP